MYITSLSYLWLENCTSQSRLLTSSTLYHPPPYNHQFVLCIDESISVLFLFVLLSKSFLAFNQCGDILLSWIGLKPCGTCDGYGLLEWNCSSYSSRAPHLSSLLVTGVWKTGPRSLLKGLPSSNAMIKSWTVQLKTWLDLFYVNAFNSINKWYKILNDKFNMTRKQDNYLHFPIFSG